MKLSVARMYYPVRVLGPGERVGIWLNGCPRQCDECASPEMQVYDPDREVPVAMLVEMIKRIKDPIDGFTISGGEPFYQAKALYELVSMLNEISDDIIIYTGYTIEELKDHHDLSINGILKTCSVLIDGVYVKELNNNKGIRGSTNQRIHVFKNEEKYGELEEVERSFQPIVYKENVLNIGIPLRSSKYDQSV